MTHEVGPCRYEGYRHRYEQIPDPHKNTRHIASLLKSKTPHRQATPPRRVCATTQFLDAIHNEMKNTTLPRSSPACHAIGRNIASALLSEAGARPIPHRRYHRARLVSRLVDMEVQALGHGAVPINMKKARYVPRQSDTCGACPLRWDKTIAHRAVILRAPPTHEKAT